MTKTFTKARIEQLSLQAQRLYRESKSAGNKINQRKSYDLIAQKEGFSSWALLMKHAMRGWPLVTSVKSANSDGTSGAAIQVPAKENLDTLMARSALFGHRQLAMTLYYCQMSMRVGESRALMMLPESSEDQHGT